MLGPDSRTLAEFDVKPEGTTVLRFAADLEANPFLRMLLLAGVLVQDPRPNTQPRFA